MKNLKRWDKESVEPRAVEEENDTTVEGQAETTENPKEIAQEPENSEEPKIEEEKESNGASGSPAEAANSTVPASKDKVDSSSLTPSFSGFSQGSMSSGDDEEDDEEEEDIRTDDVSGSQPKDSFLKEVF